MSIGKRASALDVDRAMEYLDFVVERHNVYERRQAGLPQDEWTDDPVLATKKFTQVFRWLDFGSQFVLTDLLPREAPHVALYRCVLYRYTNLPATWEYLRDELGRYPKPGDDQQKILDLLRARRDAGKQMFSGAYMIIPQPGHTGDKLLQVVALANRVMSTAGDFFAAKTQEERHAILCQHYGVGKFLGQQILTDFMYEFGEENTENEFVVEGPGSYRGAQHVAPGQPTVEVIRWAHEALHNLSACPTLAGRTPSLMDVQNTLCEFSKYVKGPRNNLYRPAHPGPLPDPIIPTAFRR